ncbi:MAG: molybdopterin dinucleotide binding domain-containing protein, partial [Candidatus Jordarchaeaceae archaeon]
KRKVVEVAFKYKKYEESGFKTPSGKIELYSTILEKEGYDPLPFYEEHLQAYAEKNANKKYPFLLTTGRKLIVYFHSELRRIPWLREMEPEARADIHPDVAINLGIKEGDYLRIETPLGSIRIKANITKRIHPKVINVTSQWEGEANINSIIDNKECAEGVGTTPLRGLPCMARKA